MENGKEVEKLYMNDMTQHKMYKLFGLRKVSKIDALEEWLSDLPTVNEKEKIAIEIFQDRLIENIDNWNEQELSLGFIGPIINIIKFKIPYKLNFFAQRPLSGVIKNYEIIGKPDGMIAGGNFEPEIPYFSFQVESENEIPTNDGEYKKDINSSGDPAGQNLAAMLVGQIQNKNEEVVYGCYVVGRFWYFMVLKGKEYAISKDYSTTDNEIFEVFNILKKLRSILFKKLNIENVI